MTSTAKISLKLQEVLEDISLQCHQTFSKSEWNHFILQYKYYPSDFIMDLISETIFFQFNKGVRHEDVMAKLYQVHACTQNSSSPRTLWAENYILDNYGIFRSRATDVVYTSSDFVLPPELIVLRRDLQLLNP